MIEIGQVVDGKYRIEQLVGQGGMGSVYAATHLVIGRRVALKVLHLEAGAALDIVKRFEREAQAAARIGNDHILDVIDFGSLADGSRYMVCEFLDGETLASRLERERQLTPGEIIPFARQLLNGLSAAHEAGVVHRDLKPENIFLLRHKAGWADFVKIIDFGISKFQSSASDEGLRMTATGAVMGTPYYLSPEQARGTRDADQRSDIYAVGVILYEAATGALPFNAQNFNDLIFKIVLETPASPHEVRPELDLGFSQLIMRAMAREPKDRFQSAVEFQGALEAWAGSVGLSLTGPIVTSDSRRRLSSSDSLTRSPRTPTPASWGGTQPAQPSVLVQPKRTGLIAGLGAAGLVLTAGLAYGLHAVLSAPSDQKPASSSQPSASVVAPPAPPPEVLTAPAPGLDDSPLPDLERVESRGGEAGAPTFGKSQKTVRLVNRPAAARPASARPAPGPPAAAPTPTPTAEAPRVAPTKRVDALGY